MVLLLSKKGDEFVLFLWVLYIISKGFCLWTLLLAPALAHNHRRTCIKYVNQIVTATVKNSAHMQMRCYSRIGPSLGNAASARLHVHIQYFCSNIDVCFSVCFSEEKKRARMWGEFDNDILGRWGQDNTRAKSYEIHWVFCTGQILVHLVFCWCWIHFSNVDSTELHFLV